MQRMESGAAEVQEIKMLDEITRQIEVRGGCVCVCVCVCMRNPRYEKGICVVAADVRGFVCSLPHAHALFLRC